jgi:hypothetical protein
VQSRDRGGHAHLPPLPHLYRRVVGRVIMAVGGGRRVFRGGDDRSARLAAPSAGRTDGRWKRRRLCEALARRAASRDSSPGKGFSAAATPTTTPCDRTGGRCSHRRPSDRQPRARLRGAGHSAGRPTRFSQALSLQQVAKTGRSCRFSCFAGISYSSMFWLAKCLRSLSSIPEAPWLAFLDE